MHFIFRQATVEDIEGWQHLRKKFWSHCSDEEHNREIKNDLKDKTKICIVALASDEVIGFIEISTRSVVDGCDSSPVAYVEGWFVDGDYQNKGIGKKLLQKSEDWARDQGFSEIGSDSEIQNGQSIEIHKKVGFEEVDRIVQFRKKL